MEHFKGLKVGQRIDFNVPSGFGRNGQEWTRKRGKIVMAFEDHVVVDGGGRYGTPYVVDEGNFLAKRKSR